MAGSIVRPGLGKTGGVSQKRRGEKHWEHFIKKGGREEHEKTEKEISQVSGGLATLDTRFKKILYPLL